MTNRITTFIAIFLTSFCFQTVGNTAGLIDIYTLAKSKDTQIREAEANFDASAQARPIARASLLPQITLTAETSDNSLDTEGQTFGVAGADVDFNSHGYSLRLTQPLYNHEFYVQLRQTLYNPVSTPHRETHSVKSYYLPTHIVLLK